jgi:phosphopentomutase
LTINRITVIVLDSLGIGELPDAAAYGDEGSNTLAHLAAAMGGVSLPHLGAWGLGNILAVDGVPPAEAPAGAYGRMAEKSAGKDTTTGHWEMAGVILTKPFPLYPHGFPPEVIAEFERVTGRKALCNKPASGTVVIQEYGELHLATGDPIVYTSGDSVFQIAAHEDVISPEELYRICRAARAIMTGDHAVSRIIARPFTGLPGHFVRTPRRHDFSLPPVGTTVLDLLTGAGIPVTGVGKISDIFAGRGITVSLTGAGNDELVTLTVEALQQKGKGFIFANLVDFDMLYGHRNDVPGYAGALSRFDARLPEIYGAMRPDDLLIITADHGCDPTTPSTDHSREYVPLLVKGQMVGPGVNLGTRTGFDDLAATIAEVFGLGSFGGESFLGSILTGAEH